MAVRVRKKTISPVSDVGELKTPEDVLLFAKNNNINIEPLDIKALASLLCIRIRYQDLDENISGSLKNENESWVISVNSSHHERRQRFTMAHELGHYFLHRNNNTEFNDNEFFRSSQMDRIEYEANNFAGALLMPRCSFMSHIENKNARTYDDLANIFNTSIAAAKIRLEVIKRGYYDF